MKINKFNKCTDTFFVLLPQILLNLIYFVNLLDTT